MEKVDKIELIDGQTGDEVKKEAIQIKLENSKRLREEKIKNIKEVESKDKAEDEDYKTIDIKFNKQFDLIEAVLASWKESSGEGTDNITAYFDKVYEEFKQLREYVNIYTFAIPSHFFATY